MRREDREVSDIKGIEEILSLCKTCHVAMVDNGLPYIVPLSFGYRIIGEGLLELYFHSALEGRKLDILRKNDNVCFETSYEGEPIDSENPCDSGFYYASVIGFGKAEFIEDAAEEKCEALTVMFKHQSGRDAVFSIEQADRVCVFKIVSTDFTGKKKPKQNA